MASTLQAISPSTAPAPTVLIVEDDEDLLAMLRRTLQRAGYAIMAAAHGGDALQQLKAKAVDLVITDILMPQMDGFEFIRKMHAEWPAVPIIAMSGIIDSSNFHKLALAYGAKAALTKPVNRADLINLVGEITASAARPGQARA